MVCHGKSRHSLTALSEPPLLSPHLLYSAALHGCKRFLIHPTLPYPLYLTTHSGRQTDDHNRNFSNVCLCSAVKSGKIQCQVYIRERWGAEQRGMKANGQRTLSLAYLSLYQPVSQSVSLSACLPACLPAGRESYTVPSIGDERSRDESLQENPVNSRRDDPKRDHFKRCILQAFRSIRSHPNNSNSTQAQSSSSRHDIHSHPVPLPLNALLLQRSASSSPSVGL